MKHTFFFETCFNKKKRNDIIIKCHMGQLTIMLNHLFINPKCKVEDSIDIVTI